MQRLLFLLLLPLTLLAQAPPGPDNISPTVPSRRLTFTPSTCNEGEAYYNLLTHITYTCTSTHTWAAPANGSIACVGTPGNTVSAYETQCQTAAGAIYACNNVLGCAVAADWVATAGSGSFTYPGAGVPNSTGSSWGTSYTVGTAAGNLVLLNGSGQLPAVSGALLTGLPNGMTWPSGGA